VATEGMFTGQFIYCGKTAQLTIGNVLPLGTMPEGALCGCAMVSHGSLLVPFAAYSHTTFSRGDAC
jgi:ribosomal protein L2